MYSNYCRHSLLCTKYFVCVRVYVCYELSMSINIVQCSLHKLKKKKKKKGQQTCHKNSKFLRFSYNRYSDTHNLQHSPLTKGFDSDFQL